jgi:hypothetical protein
MTSLESYQTSLSKWMAKLAITMQDKRMYWYCLTGSGEEAENLAYLVRGKHEDIWDVLAGAKLVFNGNKPGIRRDAILNFVHGIQNEQWGVAIGITDYRCFEKKKAYYLCLGTKGTKLLNPSSQKGLDPPRITQTERNTLHASFMALHASALTKATPKAPPPSPTRVSPPQMEHVTQMRPSPPATRPTENTSSPEAISPPPPLPPEANLLAARLDPILSDEAKKLIGKGSFWAANVNKSLLESTVQQASSVFFMEAANK